MESNKKISFLDVDDRFGAAVGIILFLYTILVESSCFSGACLCLLIGRYVAFSVEQKKILHSSLLIYDSITVHHLSFRFCFHHANCLFVVGSFSLFLSCFLSLFLSLSFLMIELPELLFARLLFVFVHSFHILLLLRKSHLNVTVVTFLTSNSMVSIVSMML